MELIHGVQVKKLRLIPDDRGFLMELLRRDWPEFEKFGQAYVTACYPGVVKAWHYQDPAPRLPRLHSGRRQARTHRQLPHGAI